MDWSVHWDAFVLAVAPPIIVVVVLVALWHMEGHAENEKVIAGLVSGKGLSRGPERRAPVARCQWRVVLAVTWAVTDGGERHTVYSMHLDAIDERLQPGGGPEPVAFNVQQQVVDLRVGTSAVWAGAFRDAFMWTDSESPWWEFTSMPESGQGARRQPPRRRGFGQGGRRRRS